MPQTPTLPGQQTVSGTPTTTVTVTANSPNSNSSVPDDLVAKVSQVLPDPAKTPTGQAEEVFDRKEYDTHLASIQDPKSKEILEKAYKSLQTGAQKKFQEAAELKRKAEATPRRPTVQELLQDPEFIREAQAYAQSQAPQGSNLSQDEWSALTPQEKQQINNMQQHNLVLQSQMSDILRSQEDERSKARYKNYEADKVTQIQKDLLNGDLKATREHLWKVIDYEDAVNRAYQYGLQDRQTTVQEKANASSLENGINATHAEDIPAKQPNQSSIEYFKVLALNRLKQVREGTLKR